MSDHIIRFTREDISTDTGVTDIGYRGECSCGTYVAVAPTVEIGEHMADFHMAEVLLGGEIA